IHQRRVIPYEELARDVKASGEFQALPATVAQWVLRQATVAWTGSCAACAACAAWEDDPSRFPGHRKLPKYLAKPGRTLLTSTEQASSRAPKNRGVVLPSGLALRVETRPTASDQVRIVPHASHYTVEVISARLVTLAEVAPARAAAVDMGGEPARGG